MNPAIRERNEEKTMKRKQWMFTAAALTALLLAACAAEPSSETADKPVTVITAETARPAVTPESAAPAVQREQVTIERDQTATLYDGSSMPRQTLPLYYRSWQGKTWAEVAAETGFSADDLRILNPNVTEDAQGNLQSAGIDLLLSEAWPIPQTEVCRVTVEMPGMPQPYDSRTYQLPNALPDDAARALALCYYQMESNGQGFITEALPDNADYVKVTSGVRFDTFSQLKSWLESVYTPEAVSAMLDGQGTDPYYKEGPDDALWIQGYAFDHIIPQSGLTCTEPQEQPDGSLRLAAVCVCVTDDEGNPLDEGQGRLYHAPVHLVPTEEGWRVDEAKVPF